MSTLFAWNLFVGGNGNDFTWTLRSNNWDYVIQWNLLACKRSKISIERFVRIQELPCRENRSLLVATLYSQVSI